MAIKKSIQTSFGVTVPDAYCRVENLRLVGKDRIDFDVRQYASEQGVPSFASTAFSCDYSLSGQNPIKQAYEHLKTTAQFTGAADC